ncbi:MAG: AAA family ATPase [Nannocystaceae bacterium]
MNESRFGRVVTFYSYKGGVGRTLALADVGVFLAKMGNRVLMIDWDLEAPGLLTYFRQWLPEGPGPDLLELIEGFSEIEPQQAAERWSKVELPEVKGELAILPAVARDAEEHAQRVQAIDWDSRYEDGFGNWLEELRAAWQRDWDYILVDSRTGYSDIGGVCTMQLPEVLVAFFTPNEQSIDGALSAARHAQTGQKRLPIDRAPLRVVPVATRLDNTEHTLRRKWESRYTEQFGPLVDEWTDADSHTTELLQLLAVPYVPFWSYGEQLPAVAGDTSDKLGVERAHESLALLLSLRLSDVGRLVEERARVSDESYRRWKYDIYISASAADRETSAQLAEVLRSHGLRVAESTGREAIEPGTRLAEVRDTVVLWGASPAVSQMSDIAVADERSRQHPTSRRLIPVMLSTAAESLPSALAVRHALRVDGRKVDEVAETIAGILRE